MKSWILALLTLGVVTAQPHMVCYVRPGARGANNGSDWNNAYTNLPTTGSMIRGATYYLAPGYYGAPNFDTAESGTATITILAATLLSHGTNVGWQNAYAPSATNVVSFSADVGLNSGYWVFSGQSRGGWTNGYNMKFRNATDGKGACIFLGNEPPARIMTNVSFSYCEFEGTHGVYGEPDNGIYLSGYSRLNNFYFGYDWAHDVGGDFISMNSEVSGGGCGIGYMFEYSFFYQNHETGNWADHDQCMQITASNLVVRYCWMQDISSSGFITDASAHQTAEEGNWQIYGNVFFWDSWYQSQTRLSGIGNGLVCLYGEHWTGPFYFCNNTIAGITNQAGGLAASGFHGLPATGMKPIYIMNNLWWHSDANSIADVGPWPGVVGTSDYNAYYQTAGLHDRGPHSEAANLNPFGNVDTGEFELIRDTAGGAALPAPYNRDMFGIFRGANGVWDRGALQISGARGMTVPQTQKTLGTNLIH